jgi:amidase
MVGNVLEVTPDPACLAALDEACGLLGQAGHEVEVVDGPLLPAELYGSFLVLWCTSAAAIPVDPGREHLLRPLTRALRDRGRGLTAVELASAQAQIGLAVRAARLRFAAYDVVVSPTLAALPAPVGGLRDDDDPWGDLAAQGRFTPYTAVLNVTGWPAMSLPLHWHQTADGTTLPVGVMLAGRLGADGAVLAVAAQLERMAPWRDRHPALW